MPDATARVIYIIRHGEKPPDPPRRPIPPQPTSGDDIYGNSGSASSLTPTGWQRAGAIGTLFFAPPGDSLRPYLSCGADIYTRKLEVLVDGQPTLTAGKLATWLAAGLMWSPVAP